MPSMFLVSFVIDGKRISEKLNAIILFYINVDSFLKTNLICELSAGNDSRLHGEWFMSKKIQEHLQPRPFQLNSTLRWPMLCINWIQRDDNKSLIIWSS